jgi:hypothetical protein
MVGFEPKPSVATDRFNPSSIFFKVPIALVAAPTASL